MNPHRTPRLSYLIPAVIIGLALSFDTIDITTNHSEATRTANWMVNLGVHTAATYAGERSESAGERSESAGESAGERSESAGEPLAYTTDPYHGMTDTERMAGVILEPTP